MCEKSNTSDSKTELCCHNEFRRPSQNKRCVATFSQTLFSSLFQIAISAPYLDSSHTISDGLSLLRSWHSFWAFLQVPSCSAYLLCWRHLWICSCNTKLKLCRESCQALLVRSLKYTGFFLYHKVNSMVLNKTTKPLYCDFLLKGRYKTVIYLCTLWVLVGLNRPFSLKENWSETFLVFLILLVANEIRWLQLMIHCLH